MQLQPLPCNLNSLLTNSIMARRRRTYLPFYLPFLAEYRSVVIGPRGPGKMQQSGVRGTGGASNSIYRVWAKMGQLGSTGNHVGINNEAFRRFKS